MQVADDGRGLDLRDIRRKAVERGLLDPDAMPSDAEIARLTLLPGFSTRDAVTEISGRGVGLDVVATRLRALVRLHRHPLRAGQGLTIELRFQASLVATHALFVRDGGQVFGIASHAVRRAVPAVAVKLAREDGALLARGSTNATTPRTSWRSLTGLAPATAPERRNLVVVDTDTGPLGRAGRCHARRRRTGHAPAGRYLKRIPGRGRHRPRRQRQRDSAARRRRARAQPARAEPARRGRSTRTGAVQRRSRVLVVDDSLSVRRAIATLLEDQGYEVIAGARRPRGRQVDGSRRVPTCC